MWKFYLIGGSLITFFWLLLPQIAYLVVALVGRVAGYHVSWRPWMLTSLVVVALWWMAYAWGHYVGRFRYEVKEMRYVSESLPDAYDGYRIVHISDLHLDGWRGHASELWHIVDTINGLRPDLICFTGDLVSMNYREASTLKPILQNLTATDGVVSILGNHDYDPYERGISDRERQANVDSLVRMERDELGWTLLLNEHRILQRDGERMAVVGVENQSCGAHQVIRRGRLAEAMAGTDGLFRILLSHDPSHWRAEVANKVDIPLTLSGHTHAMQFRIGGFTPSRWIYPECDGRYDEEGQTLYVNIGLGGTMPMRIGATPEITLITLRRNP